MSNATTQDTYEKLQEEARKAEEKAARARDAFEKERAETVRKYEAKLDEFDRGWLEEFDDEALEKAVKDARRAFDAAVAEGKGVHRAWLDYRTAAMRRYWFATEARSVADRLGVATALTLPPPSEEDFADAYKRAVSRVATLLVEDELDEMRTRREEYADGK